VNTYPAKFVPDDDGTVLATVPDVPGAISFGEDKREALANLSDALETVISGLIADRKDVPLPSPCSEGPKVSLSLLGSLKVAAYRAMRERGWRKADLARAMGLNPRQIDRLLDLRHASTVAQLEQALAACGKRADVETKALRAA
jgi:antitoxin HicB